MIDVHDQLTQQTHTPLTCHLDGAGPEQPGHTGPRDAPSQPGEGLHVPRQGHSTTFYFLIMQVNGYFVRQEELGPRHGSFILGRPKKRMNRRKLSLAASAPRLVCPSRALQAAYSDLNYGVEVVINPGTERSGRPIQSYP